MGAMLLLVLCLAAGVALRMTGRVPDNASVALNGYVLSIASS